MTDGIILREETLDASYLPPSLPHREKELALLRERFSRSMDAGQGWSQLLTGGIGSGKTALSRALAHELAARRRPKDKASGPGLKEIYVNCWRRNSDRAVVLELLNAVDRPVPDRGFSVSEMMDTFERGLREVRGPTLIILDEVSVLLKGGSKLIYMLTRGREVGLGPLSLLLIAPQDVLPYLDAASRSGFGVTHRLHLSRYSREALADIVQARAGLALRPGTLGREVAEQIARVAEAQGDARLALELLAGSARRAEEQGAREVGAEDVRWAKASLYPTITEEKLDGLPPSSLLVLLALARTLRAPGSWVKMERVRRAYALASEEFGIKAGGKVTFWRTVKALEMEGLLEMEAPRPGAPGRLTQDEIPASMLELVLNERLGRPSSAQS
ncbi:MAG: orc1/cdc6 family replication initiation protein [Euryarchaeota archaeon]|nr:orc1/cdc6 family replication initiation protein [Euryarchaeota archaeon]MDE1836366.1 orc1/cdc6 family replication initiation protein [Euryarchaeota archaeon]MDE1881805.1 orc1/cdc6 family replication initiation protein [Euryarchaeota archaeon]MDE2044238.1 orc1/cdc6 family replication initiation protein [Thermoplasmata archaeon]